MHAPLESPQGRSGASMLVSTRMQTGGTMDNTRFDDLTRRLERLTSRRTTVSALAGASLGALFGASHQETAAKRKKRKKKKRPDGSSPATGCIPQCSRKQCGDDGCGGSCGTCAVCRRCDSATQVCQPDPAQQGAACSSSVGQIC